MIVIDNVEISKNPIKTEEAFIIQIELREVNAQWVDVKEKKWSDFITKTWDKVRRKIF